MSDALSVDVRLLRARLACLEELLDVQEKVVSEQSAMLRAERDRQRQLETAAAANQAKSAFLASMSHEIRTPLNAILGYSQLMTRDPSLSEDARRYLSIINRSGEHLLDLINGVLEMSKIEAGRASLNPATFDLHFMLDDLEAMFRLRTQAKGLSFEVMKGEGLPSCIVADEGKVRQVLVNLLGNAVKFTQRGGVILRVSAARRTGKWLRVSVAVEDTGAGIATDEMTALFQRFEQTGSGRMVQAGTGLGLAISREHARLMGGDVEVWSERGKGSVFRFEFVAEEGRTEDCAPRATPRRVAAIKTPPAAPRVLLVDDQETNRDWLRQLLSKIGFEVREATNGREAVECWRAWKPELVLMDMHMPEMDGRQAIRIIRGEAGGDEVVIIAVTASAFAEDRRDVLDSGADDFVGKPVRETEVLEKIKAHMEIEYLYEEEDPPARAGGAVCGGETAASAALALLPGETVRAMREATVSGDLDRLRSLIAEVEGSAGPAVAALRGLADTFDYEGLHRALGADDTSE